jgi:hypothetical protein
VEDCRYRLHKMGMIGDAVSAIKATNVRHIALQAISLGMIVTSALIIWKGLMCFTGSESPVVVVLSGSMEPGFKRVFFFSPFFSHHVFLCMCTSVLFRVLLEELLN